MARQHFCGNTRLHPSLFRPARGTPCTVDDCGAACCVGGIWLDVGHVQKILDQADAVAQLLPPDRRDPDHWFSDEVVAHADFPSGLGTATQVGPRPDGSGRQGCVFVRADHLCALQLAGEQLGMAWPGLKPFDCATYPVLLSEGTLRWDLASARKHHGVDCQQPHPDQPPFFRVFRREIELAIGREGFAHVVGASGLATRDTTAAPVHPHRAAAAPPAVAATARGAAPRRRPAPDRG